MLLNCNYFAIKPNNVQLILSMKSTQDCICA